MRLRNCGSFPAFLTSVRTILSTKTVSLTIGIPPNPLSAEFQEAIGLDLEFSELSMLSREIVFQRRGVRI